MAVLALNYGQGLMQIKTIAERVGISNKYIEKLVPSLRATGLVSSRKGPAGGITLARKPSEINVGEIIDVFDGPIHNYSCRLHKKFTKGCSECAVAKVWARLQKDTWGYLGSMTLQDLIDMEK
jgi:Rrf2 family protein